MSDSRSKKSPLASTSVRNLLMKLNPGARIEGRVVERMRDIAEQYIAQLSTAIVECAEKKKQTLLTGKHVIEAHQTLAITGNLEALEEIGKKNNKKRKMRRFVDMTPQEQAEETRRRMERAQTALAQMQGANSSEYDFTLARQFMDALAPKTETQDNYDEINDEDDD